MFPASPPTELPMRTQHGKAHCIQSSFEFDVCLGFGASHTQKHTHTPKPLRRHARGNAVRTRSVILHRTHTRYTQKLHRVVRIPYSLCKPPISMADLMSRTCLLCIPRNEVNYSLERQNADSRTWNAQCNNGLVNHHTRLQVAWIFACSLSGTFLLRVCYEDAKVLV